MTIRDVGVGGGGGDGGCDNEPDSRLSLYMRLAPRSRGDGPNGHPGVATNQWTHSSSLSYMYFCFPYVLRLFGGFIFSRVLDSIITCAMLTVRFSGFRRGMGVLSTVVHTMPSSSSGSLS